MATENRGRIIDQALQRVGNNSTSLKVQARYRLNRILRDCYQLYDWPFLWATTPPITILPTGIVVMPPLFTKPEDDQSLTYTTPGNARVIMQEVDHKTFDQRVADWAGSHPRIWTINYTPIFGLITGRVWPIPSESLPATIRHKFLPLDATVSGSATDQSYDLDVPLFPWDTFLTDALSEWAMAYEVDPRRAEQVTINEERLARMRNATWPNRSFPSQVPLDPLFFSTPTWGSGRD